ncbi:MAG: serine/threonine-protein phosphatase [Anaerolineae bacterium]|nr:serine/threonine-protein phosphatase [Anaerolineae bacterium]
MSRKDDIKRLITKYNRRLQKLKEKEASFGLDTPVHILIEIEDIEEKLEKLQTDLEVLDILEEDLLSPITSTQIKSKDLHWEIISGASDQKLDKEGGGQFRRKELLQVFSLGSGAQTDVGSVRDLNEDSLLVQEFTLTNRGLKQPVGLYVVSDGVLSDGRGDKSAGEIASGLVVKTLSHKMANEVLLRIDPTGAAPGFEPLTWLSEAIAAANTTVYEHRQRTAINMGATIVAALVVGGVAHIGHVGDSRAYRINTQDIEQLTRDHSLVERLVATGQITPTEALDHPQRHIIYRVIGNKPQVEPDIVTHSLSLNDWLLLCSDGLHNLVSEEEMWRIIIDSPSLAEACRHLIAAANAAGGDDNISAIVVHIRSK